MTVHFASCLLLNPHREEEQEKEGMVVRRESGGGIRALLTALCRRSSGWRGCESIRASGPPGCDWLAVPSPGLGVGVSFHLRRSLGNLVVEQIVRSESYFSISSHYII